MISGYTQITPTDITQLSTTKNGLVLGTKAIARDGTIYRWTQTGATGIAAGLIVAAIPVVANHSNLALTSTSNIAVNSTKITVTLGGTAVTADQYIDGTAVITNGAGVGQDVLIVGNSAQPSTTGAVDLYLAEPIATALVIATTKVTLQPNQNASTVVAPAAATSVAVGNTTFAVPASSYYWLQTRGMASVLSQGIITKNAGAIVSASIAGAATIELAATVTQRIGYAPDATIDTQYYPIFFTID
jgi:hypothetical protein